MPAKPRSGVCLLLPILVMLAASHRPPAVALAEPPAEAKPPPGKIAGSWQGTLDAMGFELRVVFNVARDDGGNYRATLDSPDQGAMGIPVASLVQDGNQITADVKRLASTFTGTLAEDAKTISGVWKQAGREFELVFKRLDKQPNYARPQDPKKPYPYRAEEVRYQNDAAGVEFAGTLTLPKADGPVPAVLLITGSGPQDRDESIVGHRPFLVLADYLTRRGIAVLRVDDRGVGGSTGKNDEATTDDFAGDALAGVAYLKTRPEIDPRKIGLLGHSEGGLVAPLAASRSRDVAFVVLLAGTGVTGEEILHRQGELIARVLGADDEAIAKSLAARKRMIEIVKQQSDPQQAEARIIKELTELSESVDASEAEQVQLEAQAKMLLTPWLRFFLTYDPKLALRKVRCPVLAINGEKDLQVDPEQNLPPIEAALREGGNSDFTVREFPGLNHLFQHCETGSPLEYSKIEETMSPEVLELVADWISKRTR